MTQSDNSRAEFSEISSEMFENVRDDLVAHFQLERVTLMLRGEDNGELHQNFRDSTSVVRFQWFPDTGFVVSSGKGSGLELAIKVASYLRDKYAS